MNIRHWSKDQQEDHRRFFKACMRARRREAPYTAVAELLVQLGVGPELCGEAPYDVPANYDGEIHSLLAATELIPQVRRVILEDIRREESDLRKVAYTPFGRWLLDNFLLE